MKKILYTCLLFSGGFLFTFLLLTTFENIGFPIKPQKLAQSYFSNTKTPHPSTCKPFVILIPSYNNEKYCQANIRSALLQDYPNYRIIFINDCSSDRTLELVKKEITNFHNVLIIDNQERQLALANIYQVIHQHIRDEEYVILLDGDDYLAHPHVLAHLNTIYSNPKKEIWLTYGQFMEKRSCSKGFATEIPKEIVENNAFRSYEHLPTHLRTFASWLFKRIAIQDLQEDGNFYRMSWDSACMLPMIEMARNHFAFVPEILYIYNDDNPITDHRIDQNQQFASNSKIRKQDPYQPLE